MELVKRRIRIRVGIDDDFRWPKVNSAGPANATAGTNLDLFCQHQEVDQKKLKSASVRESTRPGHRAQHQQQASHLETSITDLLAKFLSYGLDKRLELKRFTFSATT